MELVIWRAEVASIQWPARAAPSAATMGQEAAEAE